MNKVHEPVLLDEVLEVFRGLKSSVFVDGTLGAGGHAKALIKEGVIDDDGLYIGLDRDSEILKIARSNLEEFGKKVLLKQANSVEMTNVLSQLSIGQVGGVLLDLGVSSYQLDMGERGFSFLRDGPLDMRMDFRSEKTAFDVVNSYTESELAQIFKRYGEVRFPRRMARRIIDSRNRKVIRTTHELASLFESGRKKTGKHPATQIFQAIRIEVNEELSLLNEILEGAYNLLCEEGRLAVITFHSLEDRIVKMFFKGKTRACKCPTELPQCICGGISEAKDFFKKPRVPTKEECERNPRARSAKLRAIIAFKKRGKTSR